MSSCRSCGADIEWAVTEANRRIPLDVGFQVDGNLEVLGVLESDGRTPVVRATTGSFPDLRRSHFASCPHAKEWRRR